jgi:hypothetical protein
VIESVQVVEEAHRKVEVEKDLPPTSCWTSITSYPLRARVDRKDSSVKTFLEKIEMYLAIPSVTPQI